MICKKFYDIINILIIFYVMKIFYIIYIKIKGQSWFTDEVYPKMLDIRNKKPNISKKKRG